MYSPLHLHLFPWPSPTDFPPFHPHQPGHYLSSLRRYPYRRVHYFRLKPLLIFPRFQAWMRFPLWLSKILSHIRPGNQPSSRRRFHTHARLPNTLKLSYIASQRIGPRNISAWNSHRVNSLNRLLTPVALRHHPLNRLSNPASTTLAKGNARLRTRAKRHRSG